MSPYQIGATQMAQTALRPAVVDFVSWRPVGEPRARHGADSIAATRRSGRTIDVEANLRQRFGVIVVGIQRQDGRMEFNPAPDAVMRAGDKLVVLGPPELLKGLEIAAQ